MGKINEIYITDCIKKYNSLTKSKKILIPDKYNATGLIKKSNFIKESTLIKFNTYYFWEYFINGVQKINDIKKEFQWNDYLELFPLEIFHSVEDQKNEILDTFLFYILRNYIKFYTLLDKLKEENVIDKNTLIISYLTPQFYSISGFPVEKYNIKWVLINQRILYKLTLKHYLKTLLYYIKKNSSKKTSTFSTKNKRIVFLMEDLPHKHYMLKKVYNILHNMNNIDVKIVIYNAINYPEIKKHIPEELHPNILFYSKFKQNTINPSFLKIYNKISKDNKYSSRIKPSLRYFIIAFSIFYTIVDNIIKKLNPSVVVHLGITPFHNKVIANSCNRFNIPSIMIDYAYIAYNINFNFINNFKHHCVISRYQQDIWDSISNKKKRHITGYIKYEVDNNNTFHKSNHLKHAIGYASTYGISKHKILYDINKLSEVAQKKGLKLIIKKHPLERDTTIEKQFSSQEHIEIIKNINTKQLINKIDMLFSAGSSILFDAIYYEIPYVETVHNKKYVSHLDLFRLPENTFALKLEFSETEKFLTKFYQEKSFRKKIVTSIQKYKEYIIGNHKTPFSESLLKVLQAEKII